ncbi:F-box only protein 6-like [Agrilus planipennis]|uniref:F-box only protein 6-like n=1 Tax=Agrilus planipennis TaxID=224129 RepID=A0A1W4X4M9_AGRPL|nr:F-box only protein 6-like [Agrilus planipennis]
MMGGNEKIPLLLKEFDVDNDENNGFILLGRTIPEEMILEILSYVDPKEILKLGLVCKNWYNITRSHLFWVNVSEKHNRIIHKQLPWYLFYCLFAMNYFDTNLIKNGNGESQFEHWNIIANGGDGFRVEERPCGSNLLPVNVPEFNGHTSCFATSFSACIKEQVIELKSKLFLYVLNEYKPHIHASEWVTCRGDCGSTYWMRLILLNEKDENLAEADKSFEREQWSEPRWTKISVSLTDYPKGVRKINFMHEGKDKQFWKGYYGSKMAGAVVRIDFDSIQPIDKTDK